MLFVLPISSPVIMLYWFRLGINPEACGVVLIVKLEIWSGLRSNVAESRPNLLKVVLRSK